MSERNPKAVLELIKEDQWELELAELRDLLLDFDRRLKVLEEAVKDLDFL